MKQLPEAVKDQIKLFFNVYSPDWRHHKILIDENAYKNREAIANELLEENEHNQDMIMAELKNGLIFDMIAQCVQYVEDLFALLNAAQTPERFIKEIVTYNTRTIHGLCLKKLTDKELLKLFLLPPVENEPQGEMDTKMKEGIAVLREHIEHLQHFYKRFYFFYIQYKHGLKVAIRPLGGFNGTQFAVTSDGEDNQHVFALDNVEVDKIYKEIYRGQLAVIVPLTDNIAAKASNLQKQDNLLRYVASPDETSIENIKGCAKMVRRCIKIFTHNFLERIGEKEIYSIYLPEKTGKVHSFLLTDTIPAGQ
jgi:hypothetical protein